MESMPMSSVDYNDQHFNQNLDQQHLHSSSHQKHHQLMSNLFKRTMDNRTLKNIDYDYQKDMVNETKLGHNLHHSNDQIKSDHHPDDMDLSDQENLYENDLPMQPNQTIGENLSMNSKKTNDNY